MTEVPEHLLRRSRERREALGLATPGSPAPAPAASESTAVERAAPAAAPAGTAAASPVAVAEPEAPPEPEYVAPAPPPRRARVPVWAMPVLVAMPLWAFLYAGAFGEREAPANPNDPLVIGARVYTQSCASCHGGQGQGSIGPAMTGVTGTFPNDADHISWVKTGSSPFRGQPYGARGTVATGGMPGFEASLSEDEIRAVVAYERERLAR